jgi:integrase
MLAYNAIEAVASRPLQVLALNTGARQGELLQLRYEDLDLERGLIYFGTTKNKKLKTAPMNRTVREIVDWLLKHRWGEHLFMWPWREQVGQTTAYDAFKTKIWRRSRQ